MQTVVPMCAKRFHRHYSGKPALLMRHYRGNSTALVPYIYIQITSIYTSVNTKNTTRIRLSVRLRSVETLERTRAEQQQQEGLSLFPRII